MRLSPLIASSFVGLVLVACSSDDATNDDGFERFMQSYCEGLVPCCEPAAKRAAGDCVATLGAKKPDIDFDREKGTACLAELGAKKGDPALCKDVAKAAPSCSAALRERSGPKKPGEPCTRRGDCASSTEGKVECAVESGGSVCELTIVGKEGDGPCAGTLDGVDLVEPPPGTRAARAFTCDYAAGLYCDRTKNACAKVQDAGGPCDPGTARSCTRTSWCNASKCTARAPVGSACDSTRCMIEATCDTTTNKCVPLAAPSAACETSDQCASHFCSEGRCATRTPPPDPALVPVCGL
jgi:hypothetical protein